MEELWEAQAEGVASRADLEAILKRQASTVYRVALSRTGNKADAEDVMQDVFVSYARKPRSFTGQEHEKAWFIRAAINRCNTLKTSAWHRRTEALTDTLACQDEAGGDVHMAMLSLKPQHRDVIFLHYYESYSVAEIAAILDITQSAVKKRLERGREKLRRMLGGEYDDI